MFLFNDMTTTVLFELDREYLSDFQKNRCSEKEKPTFDLWDIRLLKDALLVVTAPRPAARLISGLEQ